MAGRQWFAIAAIGADRPGIVADLSECVYACGCNLEDASMTMLGNEFATLMLVSGTEPDVETVLTRETRRVEWERRLTVFVRPLEGEPEPPVHPHAAAYRLTAVGVDKAGIVAGVARLLAERGVHITDLRGKIAPVPQSGTPLYTLNLRMAVPPAVELADLQSRLAGVASELDVEIDLEAGD